MLAASREGSSSPQQGLRNPTAPPETPELSEFTPTFESTLSPTSCSTAPNPEVWLCFTAASVVPGQVSAQPGEDALTLPGLGDLGDHTRASEQACTNACTVC